MPVSEDLAYQIISILVTLVFSAWNAWKNNNFTAAARVAQKLIDSIKSGKVSSEAVEDLLR
ncbi:MAG: hypothetical protein IJV88_06170 [Ruminococcus sp.]|nr:hypothetical protein [Ruminococcus sp.]